MDVNGAVFAIFNFAVNDLCANASAMGARIHAALLADTDAAARIVDIRHRGLMLGIDLTIDCSNLVQQALDAGLLINVTAGNTVRLLPPLIITAEQADALASGVAALIKQAP